MRCDFVIFCDFRYSAPTFMTQRKNPSHIPTRRIKDANA